jgi:hypothetical protein
VAIALRSEPLWPIAGAGANREAKQYEREIQGLIRHRDIASQESPQIKLKRAVFFGHFPA